jgi:hypothetical protein
MSPRVNPYPVHARRHLFLIYINSIRILLNRLHPPDQFVAQFGFALYMV